MSRKQTCVCVRQYIQSEKPNRIGRVGNPISFYTLLNYDSDTEDETLERYTNWGIGLNVDTLNDYDYTAIILQEAEAR